MRLSIVISLFFLLLLEGLAQQILSERLSVDDGLSQGMINDHIQDKEGLLWFATKNGLNRYDGYEFKVYSNSPFDSTSISEDHVTTVFEDSRGLLWVGTMSEGLNILNKSNDCFYRIPLDQLPSAEPGSAAIALITEDKAGALWVGIGKNLLKLSFPSEVKEFNQWIENIRIESFYLESIKPNPATYFIIDILWNTDGTVWASTQEGIYELDKNSNDFTKLAFLGKVNTHTHASNFATNKSGQIYFFADEGFYIINNTTKYFSLKDILSPTEISAIKAPINRFYHPRILVDDTLIYFSVYKSKIYVLEYRQNAIRLKDILHLSSDKHICRKLIQDASGLIWIGTNGYGAYRYNPQKPLFQHLHKGRSVFKITVDTEETLWMQLNSSSTSRLLKGANEAEVVIPAGNTALDDILFVDQRKIRTHFSARQKDSNTKLSVLDDALNPIYSILLEEGIWNGSGKFAQDQLGYIWKDARSKRLLRFDSSFQEYRLVDYHKYLDGSNSQKPDLENFLYFDVSNTLWLAKPFGLLRLDIGESGDISHFKLYENIPYNENSLYHNNVSSCMDDPIKPHQYLWLSTKGGGLSRLDKQTGAFRHFTTQSGLSNNVVYGILADDQGFLWLSTNKGLSRFDVATEHFYNFTVSDGLQGNEFNTSAFFNDTIQNRLYFGGVNGVTAFNPNEVNLNTYAPPTLITSIEINNSAYQTDDNVSLRSYQERIPLTLDLTHDQNTIAFQFAALDYKSPANNKYQFLLEGVMDEWSSISSNRSTYFSELASGDYTFKVRGTNSNGLLNPVSTDIAIHIATPWWETTLAYIMYACSFIGIIMYFYKHQLNRQKEQLDFKKARELDEFKTNFFTNITHEFRTPLTIISGMNDLAIEKPKEWYTKSTTAIQNNSQKLLTLVNQLLELSKVESGKLQLDLVNDDIIIHLTYLCHAFHSYAAQKSIHLDCNASIECLTMDYDPDKIQQIITNLIGNAIKFTPADGFVNISISTVDEDSKLLISVKDTGVGIPIEQQAYIFDRFYQADSSSTRHNEGTGIGLSLTKELVELMGGTISIESQVQKGTTVLVQLPIESNPDKYRRNDIGGAPIAVPTELVQTDSINESTISNNHTTPLLLIVEDNIELQQYLTACLADSYQLIYANNGAIGIEKAIQQIPDIIISDVMMPEKNGYEVCATLKSHELTSHIPIILLTAKSSIDSKIEGLEKGADAYLNKPFNRTELTIRLRKLLELRKQLQDHYQRIDRLSSSSTEEPNQENEFLLRIKVIVEEQLDNSSFSPEDLYTALGVSRSQLYRKLSALTNKSPSLYIRSIRLHIAKQMIETTDRNISEIAFDTGFSTPQYFSKCFHKEFGFSPSSIRNAPESQHL